MNTDDAVKLSYDTATGHVYVSSDGEGHAHAIGNARTYDRCVRAIHWPGRGRRGKLYVRFYKPDGDFAYITEEDRQTSYDVADRAADALQHAGHVRKGVRVLYWTTDERTVRAAEVRV